MAIKTLTISALTGGVLALAYATWSKWRAAPKPAPTGPELEDESALDDENDGEPESQLNRHYDPAAVDDSGRAQEAAEAGPVSIDVDLEGLWDSADSRRNPNEQLVDFSSDVVSEDDGEDGAVAPEGLGVRWLSRATEAMSPFHHALSVRDEAEAALLEDAAPEEEDAPESGKRPERRLPGGLVTKTRDE